MFPIQTWPNTSPTWSEENVKLLLAGSVTEPPNLKIDNILQASENFPIKFAIDTSRCKDIKTAVSTEVLERNINSVYPLVHEHVLPLYAQFILHKRTHGSSIEKELYKDMSILQFVERLIQKRAVTFIAKYDKYVLADGTRGTGKWNTIGTPAERNQLILKNCLSYDEIKLSVFLSVSSYTYFLNDGNRNNKGRVETDRGKIQPEGIIIGLIGARLKKVNVMEYEEMVITKTQNTEASGYGATATSSLHAIFANFYQEPCFTYENAVSKHAEENSRFTVADKQELFDNVVYAKRIGLSIDTLLLEANQRAKERETTAFIHVVGIGLGVWKFSPHQNQVFVDTFVKRIEALAKNLHCVSDVFFAYIGDVTSCAGKSSGTTIPIEGHPKNGITVFLGKREPHVKLVNENEGKLLVVSYAWDGNALPGNEFWLGKLGSTGDSAAAASTQITELHNPHINKKVCAENLRIITQSGAVSFQKYRDSFANI